MPDPTAMLQEFAKYLEYVELDGRKPSEEDVDNFIEGFLNNLSYYFIPEQGVQIQTAYQRDKQGNRLYPVSSHSEAVKEIKPILLARVIEAHGEVTDHTDPFDWDTKPTTVDEYALLYAKEMQKEDEYLSLTGTDRRNHKAYQKGVNESLRIKYRLNQYMKKVLPFTMRVTMHHQLGFVTYSTINGPDNNITKVDEHGNPITLNDEDDLTEFMQSETMDGFPAAKDSSLRSVFWTPTVTGKGLKMGVININNPAKLPMKNLLRSIKKIHKIMAYDLRHPCIIMYTGNSYQIWFGMNENEKFSNFREMQDYLKMSLYSVGSFNSESAIQDLAPFLDLKKNAPGEMVRAFFSLHYPTNRNPTKTHTGRAAIPVAPADLESFNPAKDAHPEAVLANFDVYSSYVATFYDKVQIGQDYESEGETEATPTCSRLDKAHKEASALKALYKPEDLIQVEYRNVGTMLEDEKKIYAHPVARGVLAVLVYDPKGTNTPPGMTTQRSRRGRVITESPNSYYILNNGVVIYDDYICRDLERVCLANKIKQAILVGRISMIDSFGQEEGESETRNALIRTEGINPMDARVMRFAVNRASSVNFYPIPIEMMDEQMQVFSTKRIVPATYFELTEPVGMKLKKRFMSLVKAGETGAMLVEGEERYLVKSTRTVYATIIAMDTSGRAYETNEIPNVIIALAKPSSKYGAEYIVVAKAQIALKKEDRITLRTLVEGPERSRVIPMGRQLEESGAQIEFFEPSVVVEVSYDDVTPQRYPNLTAHFTSSGRFRLTENDKASNRLINARVIAIKEDLDHRKPSHINVRQEELIEVTRTSSKSDSLLSVLPNPSPFAVFVVAKVGNKYAATTRDDGRIGLPGGKVDPGESPQKAALREATEEGWGFPPKTKLTLIHSQNVEGKPVSWYQASTTPKPLAEYKEKHRSIRPILISEQELTASGFGNENLPLSNPLPEFIKRNPAFFGVPDSLTSYFGGVPGPDGYFIGGRKIEIPLIDSKKSKRFLGEKLPTELESSYNRYRKDLPGYKTFVDVDSLVAKQSPPNYRVTDLGWEYTNAVDDTFGMGQDGNAVTKMDDKISPIKSYTEVIDMVHFGSNAAQAKEDAKVINYTMQEVPGDAASEEPNRRSYDMAYQAEFVLRDKKLGTVLGPTKLGMAEQEALAQQVLNNPPVKADIWQQRVELYTEEFNKWATLPEPKEGWENYAIGMFITWEVPLLEKERLLRAAKSEYELSDEEVNLVDSQYADPPTEDIFDLLLSDLYEVPDDDEIDEQIV